jgi:hypothetical protein
MNEETYMIKVRELKDPLGQRDAEFLRAAVDECLCNHPTALSFDDCTLGSIYVPEGPLERFSVSFNKSGVATFGIRKLDKSIGLPELGITYYNGEPYMYFSEYLSYRYGISHEALRSDL